MAAALALACAGTASVPSGAAQPGSLRPAATGEALYAANCASCHGAELQGDPDWRTELPDGGVPAPPLDGSGHTWHHPDWLLFGVVKRGGRATAHADFKSHMPAFEGILSDDEILEILSFIKQHWPESERNSQAFINRMQPRPPDPPAEPDER